MACELATRALPLATTVRDRRPEFNLCGLCRGQQMKGPCAANGAIERGSKYDGRGGMCSAWPGQACAAVARRGARAKRPVEPGVVHLPPSAYEKPPRGRLVHMADGVGFEPTRRFPAYTLSRRAPSTTRPPVLACREEGPPRAKARTIAKERARARPSKGPISARLAAPRGLPYPWAAQGHPTGWSSPKGLTRREGGPGRRQCSYFVSWHSF